MNIIVCLKQTCDTEAVISLTPNGRLDDAGAKRIINPYDEYAVEEALRIKEKFGGEVTILTLGDDSVRVSVLAALAMGADKAVIINQNNQVLDERYVAEALSAVIGGASFDLILTGRMSVDNGSSQVPARIAEKLAIPLITNVVSLVIEEGQICAIHDVDGGRETVLAPLPAVLSAQKGLNEPRYPSTVGIMKAKKKPMSIIELSALSLDSCLTEPTLQVVGYDMPPARAAGRFLQGNPSEIAEELVTSLHQSKVI